MCLFLSTKLIWHYNKGLIMIYSSFDLEYYRYRSYHDVLPVQLQETIPAWRPKHLVPDPLNTKKKETSSQGQPSGRWRTECGRSLACELLQQMWCLAAATVVLDRKRKNSNEIRPSVYLIIIKRHLKPSAFWLVKNMTYQSLEWFLDKSRMSCDCLKNTRVAFFDQSKA